MPKESNPSMSLVKTVFFFFSLYAQKKKKKNNLFLEEKKKTFQRILLHTLKQKFLVFNKKMFTHGTSAISSPSLILRMPRALQICDIPKLHQIFPKSQLHNSCATIIFAWASPMLKFASLLNTMNRSRAAILIFSTVFGVHIVFKVLCEFFYLQSCAGAAYQKFSIQNFYSNLTEN